MTVTDLHPVPDDPDAADRSAARELLRSEPQLTGADLGARFNKTPEWGRKQRRNAGLGRGTGKTERRKPTGQRSARSGTEQRAERPAARAERSLLRFATTGNATTAGLVVVAVVAASASYTHTRDLASSAGQGWLATILPFSIDGLVIVGTRALLVGRARVLAWAAVAIGLISSMAANVVAVDPTLVEMRFVRWVMAGYPPVALAMAMELLRRMSDTQPKGTS